MKRFGDKAALDGVDISVPTGTVTAVLGPNGAGKTTAVRILTTLSDADEGTATVAGFDVAHPAHRGAAPHRPRRPGRHRRPPAHRPREPRDDRRAAPARRARRRPARGRRCSSSSPSPTPREQVVGGYSGGMRRRLDLAATLVARPRCCSSTSPPPGSTPGPATSCGTCSTPWSERHDPPAHHPVPRGGRPPGRRHPRRRPRPGHRPRRRPQPQAPGGRRQHRRHRVRRGPPRRGGRACSAGSPAASRRRPPASAPPPPPPATASPVLAEVANALADAGHRGRGPQPAPAHPRRGLPHPHRQPDRPTTTSAEDRTPQEAATDTDHPAHRRRPPTRVVAPTAAEQPHPRKGVLHDTWVLARRGLIHMKRQPEQLSDATIQPIMFVVLFALRVRRRHRRARATPPRSTASS